MSDLHRPTRTFHLFAKDGYPLSAALHEPDVPVRSVVVLLGATAVPRGFYDRFAHHLSKLGHRVLTFDYRGIGGSRPETLRGFEASMRDWAELDAGAAIEHAKHIAGDLPVLAVGHSFGGHVLGLRSRTTELDAIVLVGSQLPYWKHWRGLDRLKVAAFWYGIVPLFASTLGYVPGRVGVDQDLPAAAARDWARWGSHPDYLVGHVEGAKARFAAFTGPALVYSFTDDWFAPRAATESLLSRLSGAKLTHRRIHPSELGAEGVGHFGFFKEKPGKTLWHEVAGFFDDVLSGGELHVRSSCIDERDVLADLAFGRD